MSARMPEETRLTRDFILLTAMRWVLKEQCAVGIDEIISIVNQFEQPVTFLGIKACISEYIAENCSVPYTFVPAHVNKQRAGAVAALGTGKFLQRARSETAAEHKPEYLRRPGRENEKRAD